MSTASRPRATFGTTTRDVPGVQDRALKMYNGIMANAAIFASPTITMVAFLALMTALAVAQQNATSMRASGLATLRNTKRNALWTAMGILRAYIQGLADAASADTAASIIEAGGLLVARPMERHKPVLTAKLASAPGVVHLTANATVLVGAARASRKVTLHWQWSADGGGSWHNATSTPYVSTDVAGLTPMTTYSFRVSATIGRVTGEWSQAVSLLVQ